MFLRNTLLALAALALAPGIAHAAKSYDNCTGFIDAVPTTITTQGTWCLRKDLSTAIASGAAITVATNNVTIDCNDFKLGNLSAGAGTLAYGVFTDKNINVAVRNCKFRGFQTAVHLLAPGTVGNYRVERNNVQGATNVGIRVGGDGSVVRGNALTDIGGSTAIIDGPVGIYATRVVDVVDNAITDVAGEYGSVGIIVYQGSGSSIRGNRIRGVLSYTSQVWGVLVSLSGHTVIRGNDIFTPVGDFGVDCVGDSSVRVLDNTIAGFATGLKDCGNAGGNDISL